MSKTVTVSVEDLRDVLDDWADLYENKGYEIEQSGPTELYRRLRALVNGACDHPMDRRTRRRDGSFCRQCSTPLPGQFKPQDL